MFPFLLKCGGNESLYEGVRALLHTFQVSLSIYWRAKCCKW